MVAVTRRLNARLSAATACYLMRPDSRATRSRSRHQRIIPVVSFRKGTGTVLYCAGSPSAGYTFHHGSCACGKGSVYVSNGCNVIGRGQPAQVQTAIAQGSACKIPVLMPG